MVTMNPVCPLCRSAHRQTRAGRAANGNQRFQCQDCKRFYTYENRRYRYPITTRQKAVELYCEGIHVREIARLLDVNHQTIAKWIDAPCSNHEV